MVDSTDEDSTTEELEEPPEPVVGELEVMEETAEDTVVDSVEAAGVDSVEATTVVPEEATRVLEEVETETKVLPPVGPVGKGPVSAGDEGVNWAPVECSLVV